MSDYMYQNQIRMCVEDSSPNFVEYNNELDKVYAEASKADEYEAKTKLADEIIQSFYEIRRDMKHKLVDYELGYQTIGTEVSKYIKEYESGEKDE